MMLVISIHFDINVQTKEFKVTQSSDEDSWNVRKKINEITIIIDKQLRSITWSDGCFCGFFIQRVKRHSQNK
jgi:hypothetical protein